MGNADAISAPKTAAPYTLAGLVLAGLLLRVAFFSGYAGTDDTFYIEAARRVSAGDLTGLDTHFAARSGLVMPTAAAYTLFGVSLWTSVWLPFVCSLAAITVTFVFARRVFDTPTGLLAAGLLVVFPLDVIFASELFACVPLELFAGLAAYCLVCDRDHSGSGYAALAGVCVGVAALAGETALFCVFPAAYYFVFVGRRRERALVFAAALVAVMGLESLMYGALTGDPLLRWRILTNQVAIQGSDAMSSGVGIAYLLHPFVRLLSEQELGIFPLLLVPALWYHVTRSPSPYSRFLAFWVVSIFLYTSYGTTSPFRFAPLPRLPRYLAPTVVPALVLLASFLTWCRPRTRYAALVALVVTSLVGVGLDNGRHVKDARKGLHAFIAAHADDRVVLDPPLFFDEMVFRGFQADTRLSVFAPDAQEWAAIERRRAVYGPWAVVVGDLRTVRGALVAVTRPASLEAAAAIPGAERIATFTPPDRLYYRLLRSPFFLQVLALVRDQYRVEGMPLVSGERIEVYRVP